jgi:two-component system, OmpR family, clock-associated histidine kinase SasA
MQVSQEQPIYSEAPLQLLLFVDERPSSRQQVQRIRVYLQELSAENQFELQVVNVGEQPYLAEHFKLVATPALVKIRPEPRQTLAGSNIISELRTWWPKWQAFIDTQRELQQLAQGVDGVITQAPETSIRSLAVTEEIIQLSDEVFRLKQENDRLQEQLIFKDRVIGMLAHDLRNPLTAAAIAIETLESNYNPQARQFKRLTPNLIVQVCKQARSQTRIIDRMITDLLEVAKSKETDFRIQPQKIALGNIFIDVLQELSDRYTSKFQQIQTDIPQDFPCVYADPERVRQVVINLLDNAIKYTPEGGLISIFGIHRTTQKVQFSIEDNGPGIPEENRIRIFDNHFRLQRDIAKEGYGIGLALCQRIIRAHYGQIWVDSNPNGGACFHFTLPVYPI